MKRIKQIILRFFLGMGCGMFIGYLVNLVVSMCIGNGAYIPAMPFLVEHCGSEINAVHMQNLLTGLVGVAFCEASFIFEKEDWSLLRCSVVHFLITLCFYAPCMWICYMPENGIGVLSMVGNLFFTYALTYLIRWQVNRRMVAAINQRLQEEKRRE